MIPLCDFHLFLPVGKFTIARQREICQSVPWTRKFAECVFLCKNVLNEKGDGSKISINHFFQYSTFSSLVFFLTFAVHLFGIPRPRSEPEHLAGLGGVDDALVALERGFESEFATGVNGSEELSGWLDVAGGRSGDEEGFVSCRNKGGRVSFQLGVGTK